MRLFLDLDGTLAEWRQPSFLKEERDFDELEKELDDMLHIPGYYYSLCPNENLVKGVCLFHERYPSVPIYITTQALSSQAAKEKIIWSLEKLPFLKKENIIIIPYLANKTQYIPGGINKGDVMIDDFNKNLLEAQKAGIIPVKFLNGINSRTTEYEGFNYISNLRTENQILLALEQLQKELPVLDKVYLKKEDLFDYTSFPFNEYLLQMEDREQELPDYF